MWIMLCFGRLEKWAVRACPPSVTLPSPLHTLPASLVMSVGCWKSVPRLGTRKPRGHARTRALGVFPGVTSGEEPASQCRKHQRCRFDPWVRKSPWRRERLPTPVSLPGESHGQRSLEELQSMGLQRATKQQQNEMSNLKTPNRMGTSCTSVSQGSQDSRCPASQGQVVLWTQGWTRLWETG